MGEPRQPNNAASDIAKQMRTKGMNTTDIMRSLFESANALDRVSAKAGSFAQAIATDGIAAGLLKNLETQVEASLHHLQALIGNTKSNLANLSTHKPSQGAVDGFKGSLEPLEKEVNGFVEKQKEYIKYVKGFIPQMRDAFRKLSANPNDEASKKLVEQLNSTIQTKAEEAKRNLSEGEGLQKLVSKIRTININVAQATATATGKPAEPPTPPPTLT